MFGGLMTEPITVTLAEDSVVFRRGLEVLLALDDGLKIIDLCGDLDELLTSVRAEQPNVVLTDIRMPPTNNREGIEAAETIGDEFPTIGVIVLSQYVDPSLALAVLGDGTRRRGYILKENLQDAEQLCTAIRAVAGGGSYIDPDVLNELVEGRTNGNSGIGRLSVRELEVLKWMAHGLNNQAISETLFIGERTVEKHIGAIYAKLDLSAEEDTHKRVKAVLYYLNDRGESTWPPAPE